MGNFSFGKRPIRLIKGFINDTSILYNTVKDLEYVKLVNPNDTYKMSKINRDRINDTCLHLETFFKELNLITDPISVNRFECHSRKDFDTDFDPTSNLNDIRSISIFIVIGGSVTFKFKSRKDDHTVQVKLSNGDLFTFNSELELIYDNEITTFSKNGSYLIHIEGFLTLEMFRILFDMR